MKRLTMAATLAFLLLGFGGKAAAQPDEHASCVGTLTVFNTQHPEVFGTRADLAHDIKQFSDATGTTPGAIVSSIAHEHGGSVGECLG